jgi:glucan phosphoethanolaminetransferase (alkaline phosphatase superfamily)
MIAVCVTGIFLLLMIPGIINEYEQGSNHFSVDSIKRLMLSLLFLLLPVAFFYKRIKLYLYLLTIWIIFTPLFIYSQLLFEIKPNFELVTLVVQSNFTEMIEIAKGRLGRFLLITVLYVAVYLFLVKKLPVKVIPFKISLAVSLFAAVILMLQCYRYLLVRKQDYRDFFCRYYPISIISGIADAYTFLNRNNLDRAKQFSFHAYKKDKVPARQIYVFIIGETSRYDRWQINGYSRATSPRLNQRENLISFPDMIAGSNLTYLSVPQMITRACPDDMDRQYKEKSFLSAFHDAGFRTVWLSTQSDQQVLWMGVISNHAKTADVVHFCRTYSPMFELEDLYDERLLPKLDSIIHADGHNLFIVLHTMGSHWDYSRRYPARFDVFKPSLKSGPGKEHDLTDETISNSYDNSILYADYIVDSVIRMVEKQAAVSYVTYLSDHGEQISKKLESHTYARMETLHVPFFLWTSEGYRKYYPGKFQAIMNNRNKKISGNNIFYSLLDLANIGFAGMDQTKSIADSAFRESDRKYYDALARRSWRYADLLKPAVHQKLTRVP